ncbi:MAG TPA: GAF domain-containing protein [Thermomicrobiaceae bacterium]|nr:GAF domain-containing protein [Thermomicrobiaceae bacterium]
MTHNTIIKSAGGLRAALDELFEQEHELATLYQGVCDLLNQRLKTYSWVGIYLLEGDELVLAAWQGPAPTEHVRIPNGEGICGYAASHNESVIIEDVSQDPRYLQCFLGTRSEIVVPISSGETVYGEIDVDGDEIGAFTEQDDQLLREIAGRLAEQISASRR